MSIRSFVALGSIAASTVAAIAAAQPLPRVANIPPVPPNCFGASAYKVHHVLKEDGPATIFFPNVKQGKEVRIDIHQVCEPPTCEASCYYDLYQKIPEWYIPDKLIARLNQVKGNKNDTLTTPRLDKGMFYLKITCFTPATTTAGMITWLCSSDYP